MGGTNETVEDKGFIHDKWKETFVRENQLRRFIPKIKTNMINNGISFMLTLIVFVLNIMFGERSNVTIHVVLIAFCCRIVYSIFSGCLKLNDAQRLAIHYKNLGKSFKKIHQTFADEKGSSYKILRIQCKMNDFDARYNKVNVHDASFFEHTYKAQFDVFFSKLAKKE